MSRQTLHRLRKRCCDTKAGSREHIRKEEEGSSALQARTGHGQTADDAKRCSAIYSCAKDVALQVFQLTDSIHILPFLFSNIFQIKKVGVGTCIRILKSTNEYSNMSEYQEHLLLMQLLNVLCK